MKKYIFLLFISLMLNAYNVLACSCKMPASPENALKDAVVVFAGKVNKIQEGNTSREVTFDVQKSFKGVGEKVITISTSSQGNLCGMHFEES